jgi:1,4-dihydroxy-2-naphthoate polyprenyltransferase
VSTLVLVVGSSPWFLLLVVVAPLAVPLVRKVLAGARGPDLIPVLAGTGRVQLAYGVVLAAALVLA